MSPHAKSTFFIGFLVLSPALAPTAPARAEAARRHLLHYQAPAECPDAATMEAAIESAVDPRRPHLRAAAIDIVHREGRFEATLALAGSSGEVTNRLLSGESCSELVDALALVVAMSGGEPAAPAAPPPAPAPAAETPADPAPAPAAVRRWRYHLAGRASTTYGVSSSTNYGPGVVFEAEDFSAPRFRVGVRVGVDAAFGVSATTAADLRTSAVLTTVWAQTCLGAQLKNHTISGCGGVRAGVVVPFSGGRIPSFSSVDTGFRMRNQISRHFHTELDLGLIIPAFGFVRSATDPGYSTWPVLPFIALGVGATF